MLMVKVLLESNSIPSDLIVFVTVSLPGANQVIVALAWGSEDETTTRLAFPGRSEEMVKLTVPSFPVVSVVVLTEVPVGLSSPKSVLTFTDWAATPRPELSRTVIVKVRTFSTGS